MKRAGILLLAAVLTLSGCAASRGTQGSGKNAYQQIDQETAGEMLSREDGHILVDVRRTEEYALGHIPGAICLPNENIGLRPPEELPDPDQTILIYCRSGNRSRQAAEKLAAMGYTQVFEFGGINDWTGEVVTGQTLLLRVESNPTTGYRWTAEQEPGRFEIREFYTAAPQSRPVSGAGGWQTFLLTPREPGQTEVRFTYSRSWEPNDSDPGFTLELEIAGDLSLRVTEDGSAQAMQQGYTPVIRIY